METKEVAEKRLWLQMRAASKVWADVQELTLAHLANKDQSYTSLVFKTIYYLVARRVILERLVDLAHNLQALPAKDPEIISGFQATLEIVEPVLQKDKADTLQVMSLS